MKTRSRKLFLILPILLVLLSCSFMNGFGQDNEVETALPKEVAQLPSTVEISPESPTPDSSPTAAIADIPVMITNTVKETQETPKFTFEMDYPYIEGSPEYNSFNLEIIDEIAAIQAEFLQFVNDNEEWRSQNMPELGNEMAVTYDVMNASKGLISIRFNYFCYIAGSAHPNSYQFTKTYDLYTKSFLTLDDLFIPGSEYLQKLSEYSITYLEENGTLDWPETGANPVPENYENWNILEDGILITFNPYQVASYAAGPQQALVPYSELAAFIGEESTLNRLLQ